MCSLWRDDVPGNEISADLRQVPPEVRAQTGGDPPGHTESEEGKMRRVIKRLVVVVGILLASWSVVLLAIYGAVRLWDKYFPAT